MFTLEFTHCCRSEEIMKRLIFIILCLLFSINLFSQQIKVVRDFGVRGGVTIEKDLCKSFEFNIEQQLRLFSNATKFDDYIIDFGGKYKLNKNFKLGSNLRYTYNQNRTKDAENNYRYNFDLLYKNKFLLKLYLTYRLRYQHEYVNLSFRDHSENIKYSGIRNKVEVQYSVTHQHEIFLSGELFRLIQTYREPYFNKLRFYVGDEVKTKFGRQKYSFGYEQELNDKPTLSFFFIEAIYLLKL